MEKTVGGVKDKFHIHFRKDFEPLTGQMLFLKKETEVYLTRSAGYFFQYFTSRTKRSPGPYGSLQACPLSPVQSGRRKKSDELKTT